MLTKMSPNCTINFTRKQDRRICWGSRLVSNNFRKSLKFKKIMWTRLLKESPWCKLGRPSKKLKHKKCVYKLKRLTRLRQFANKRTSWPKKISKMNCQRKKRKLYRWSKNKSKRMIVTTLKPGSQTISLWWAGVNNSKRLRIAHHNASTRVSRSTSIGRQSNLLRRHQKVLDAHCHRKRTKKFQIIWAKSTKNSKWAKLGHKITWRINGREPQFSILRSIKQSKASLRWWCQAPRCQWEMLSLNSSQLKTCKSFTKRRQGSTDSCTSVDQTSMTIAPLSSKSTSSEPKR